MAIIFGSICPHPPILIPEIGKENIKQIEKTRSSMQKLEGDLYVTKPETIIIISPHGAISPDVYYFNISEKFTSNLEEFGDMNTKLEFNGDIALASTLKQSAEIFDMPVNTISQPILDHGSVVPLYYLTNHLPDIKILPISYSLLPYENHFEFGKFLYKQLIKNNKRIAVVASGDLSHRLTKDSPAGFSPKGMEFDKLMKELIKNKKIDDILKIDKQVVEDAGECGLRSILILLGIFNQMNYTPEILSYEGTFGVGYLVANLVIK